MVRKLEACVVCGNRDLEQFLDLGNQPFANSYLKDVNDPEETAPLALNLCSKCFHVQLTHAVNPDLLFRNYLYVSGTSKTFRDYLEKFAEPLMKRTPGSMLEIACNDGSLMHIFKNRGWDVMGVDPATNLRELTKESGLEVIPEYWNLELARKMDKKFDLVVAMHVLPHVQNPLEFLGACSEVLAPGGKIVVQTSQCRMFFNNEYDCTYHEHISYFSIRSLKQLAKQVGLECSETYEADIHGTSYVITFSNKRDDSTDKLEKFEESKGRYEVNLYRYFGEMAKQTTKHLVEAVKGYQEQGLKVVGYGASAKGNTVLNYAKLKLDYIVDDNQLKWGMYTPGMKVPIRDPRILRQDPDAVIVPLAWNFLNEIRENVSRIVGNPYTTYIKYFPKLEIVGGRPLHFS
jgi:cyclopropane fatty-acyl-phospholipid synthase-like methyltransferase